MSESQRQPNEPVVAVQIMTNGDINYLLTEGVTVLVIDENCDSDRVYHYQSTTPVEVIAGVVGDSRIGQLGDRPRDEALIRRVLETGKFPGEPGFLAAIEPTQQIEEGND